MKSLSRRLMQAIRLAEIKLLLHADVIRLHGSKMKIDWKLDASKLKLKALVFRRSLLGMAQVLFSFSIK